MFEGFADVTVTEIDLDLPPGPPRQMVRPVELKFDKVGDGSDVMVREDDYVVLVRKSLRELL